jgi:hypothetical protein
VYQPKIRDELIPRLYRQAKALNIPMTHLINHIVEHGITRIEQGAENVSDLATTASRRRERRKGKRHVGTT